MSASRRFTRDPRPVHLVGATGSAASRVAVREAAVAAARAGAVLHLVNAFDVHVRREHSLSRFAAPGDVAFAANPAGDAEILLAEEAHLISDISVAVAPHPVGGEAGEALRKAAMLTHAEVVTIGSSQPHPRRFGLAWRLLRACPCDVRIVAIDGTPAVRHSLATSPARARATRWGGVPTR